MYKPLDTDKLILIDFDDEDAMLYFKDELPDLTDYQFHHTASEASGENIDVYYNKHRFIEIEKYLTEKYSKKS